MAASPCKIKRKSPTFLPMTCTSCGEACERRAYSQLYCEPCSLQADMRRKKSWAAKRAESATSTDQARWASSGKMLSEAERCPVFGAFHEPPDLIWYSRVAFPFSWAGSKNRIYSVVPKGHVALRRTAKEFRSGLTTMVKNSVKGQRIAQNKLWIDIFVQKPNHKGDATNFLDLICDAIKDATDLDDRWYSVRGINWQIAKRDPMIYVGLGQDTNTDVQACSTCGRLLEFHFFQKSKNARNGIGRVCKECSSGKPRPDLWAMCAGVGCDGTTQEATA